jgi:hypothetical protein
MKHDSGSIEFSAALLLFFIAAVIAGAVTYAAAVMGYFRTGIRDFNVKTEADLLLDAIITEMQPLRLYPYDDKENVVITGLCQKYEAHGLIINDVSSGYHLDFLSDEVLADGGVAGYLFRDKTGAGFTAWLKANGLSASREKWREFINEEAWNSCVSYGWLHKDDAESFAFRHVSLTFNSSSPDKLYPLVNDFPRMNVNMVNPGILNPLVMRDSFKIEKPKEKADALADRLRTGPVSLSDISSILKIPAGHPLMGYFGTKTAFWKIRFSMRKSITVEAVVAAIPKKDGAIQEIESYRLIDRVFSYD